MELCRRPGESSSTWEHLSRVMTLAAMHIMVSLSMELCIFVDKTTGSLYSYPADGIIMGTMVVILF